MSDFELYPEKPSLIEVKRRNNWAVTLFSMALFVLIFSYIFEDQMNVIFFLVGVLFIHELGHYWAMKHFKYRNVRMLFIPILGAFVHGKKDKYSQKESLWVILSGPFPGILLGVQCVLLSEYFNWSALFLLGIIFLLLNVLNLLPIDPLDGGQLVRSLFYSKSNLFLLIFSLLSSILMIFIGFWLSSNLLILFGFFMGIRVRSIQKKRDLQHVMDNQGIQYEKAYDELSNQDFFKIKNILLNRNSSLQKYTEIAEKEEVDDLLAHQVNNALTPPMKIDASLFFRIVLLGFWILALFSPIILYFVVDHNWMNYAVRNW